MWPALSSIGSGTPSSLEEQEEEEEGMINEQEQTEAVILWFF